MKFSIKDFFSKCDQIRRVFANSLGYIGSLFVLIFLLYQNGCAKMVDDVSVRDVLQSKLF